MRKGWFRSRLTARGIQLIVKDWRGWVLILVFLLSEGGVYLLMDATRARWPLSIGGMIFIAFFTAVIILHDHDGSPS